MQFLSVPPQPVPDGGREKATRYEGNHWAARPGSLPANPSIFTTASRSNIWAFTHVTQALCALLPAAQERPSLHTHCVPGDRGDLYVNRLTQSSQLHQVSAHFTDE